MPQGPLPSLWALFPTDLASTITAKPIASSKPYNQLHEQFGSSTDILPIYKAQGPFNLPLPTSYFSL